MRTANLRPDDTAGQARSNVVQFPTTSLRPDGKPRSLEVQAKLDRLKAKYGFDPDADAKLTPQERADRIERRQRESGFDIDVWRQEVIAERQRILEELGPEPEPKPYTPEEIAKIVAEVEAAMGKKIVRVTPTTDVLRRDDARTPHLGVVSGQGQQDGLVLISAADIVPVNVVWLWRNWMPRGAVSMLAGQSTAGKSTIALAFCATITSGGLWPDGQPAGDPARAVFWSGEDDIKDTLLPRFLAAGGEPSLMHFIGEVRNSGRKRLFDPATDMPKLVEAVERLRDVRLIVLDPVALAVKGGDSHKNVETRVGLQPFVDLCTRTGAAGLGIHHFTKNTAGGHPLERLSGSLAFHALPRAVLIAARDQSDGGPDARRAMVRGKVSNGPDGGGFDYKLDQYPLDDFPEIVAQRVLWGDFLKGSPRELLDAFEPQKVAGKPHPTVIFLKAALAGGPRLAAELYAEAGKIGIAERSLRYHYKKLGGVHDRVGFGGPVIWELPKPQEGQSAPEPPAPPEGMP